VIAEITCVHFLELTSFLFGLIIAEIAMKLGNLDGVLHAFMGAMILVGSICLVFGIGVSNALDENVSIFNIPTFSSNPILFIALPKRRIKDRTPSKESQEESD